MFETAAGALLALSIGTGASGQWAPYDDFSDPPAGLDDAKWLVFVKGGALPPIEMGGQAAFDHPVVAGVTESRLVIQDDAVAGVRADVQLGSTAKDLSIQMVIRACDSDGQPWTLAFRLNDASNPTLCAVVEGPSGLVCGINPNCIWQANALPFQPYTLEILVDTTGVSFSVNGASVASCVKAGLVPLECAILSSSKNNGGTALLDNVWTRPIDGLGAPWLSVMPGVPGKSGTPALCGIGSLVAGTPGKLLLTKAAPSALSYLFVSPSMSRLPFKCGFLVPVPSIVEYPHISHPTTGAIQRTWQAWPAGMPIGTTLYMQFAVFDAEAPAGISLSNALEATAP
jgi:hypothetical protein